MIVKDAATETRFALLPRMLGEDVVSALSVVIATPEGPYGALGAHSRRQRTFTQDEVNFLQAVANVLGSAIQRERSEERLRRSNRALVALSNCNQALIRATDETALLATRSVRSSLNRQAIASAGSVMPSTMRPRRSGQWPRRGSRKAI